ncbi:hypothetical protein HNQ79_006752 [Streptomyces candidus]|uniref:Uncharacterized protein n=2 Tax=Streptomyces candidus TaxID=67283 RepID=A0A7X0HM50_9ACTN|nr:hypothetical protein [Streptomyces candidus]MBB6440237.1 hypothetical protein [Streptomyces candidus]
MTTTQRREWTEGDRVQVSSEYAINTNGWAGTVRKGTTGDWGWIVGVELDRLHGYISWRTPDELIPEPSDVGA